MKKQLRIFLFAAMLVLLLGVTVLAVSAAGEWRLYADQTAADADTSNTAGTAYDTVAAAVSDIDTNGMVVKLTTDLTGQYENNATFSNTHTYTIDCDGHSIAYQNGDGSRGPFWRITAGNVTIKDLTLNRTGYSNSHITFSGTPTVVLENLILTGADNCFGTIGSAVNLTIQGADTSFTDIDTYIAKLGNGSLGGLITIKAGTFCIGSVSKGNAGKRIGFMCGGAKIKVEGGTFNIGSIANFAYETVDATDKNVNGFFNMGDNAWSSPVEITSGTFNLSGSGWLFDVPGSEKWAGLGNCSDTYAMGNDMIRISGGTFDMTGSAGLVHWRANYGEFARRDGSAITGQPTISITGGTFKSQTVTLGFFRLEDTQESNRCVINLEGGTFAGGKQWVVIGTYGTVNFCGADFTSEYPNGDDTYTTVDPGSNGFICSWNGGRLGSVNFTAGTITNNKTGDTSYLVRGSGVVVTVSGTVTITTSSPFVRHLDNNWNSPVLITGGTFNLADNGYVLYAYRESGSTYGQPYRSAALGNDIVRITGGTFNVTGGNAKIFRIRVNYPMYSHVDGTVTSGHPNLTVTGGTFNITASADAFSDNSTAAPSSAPILNISGGTFTDSGSGDMFYTNAYSNLIVNVTGTTASFTKTGGRFFVTGEPGASGTYQPVFNIKGGTFNAGSGTVWIQARDSAIYNLGDPDNLSSAYPRFSGSVDWAIALKNKSAGIYRTGTTGGQVHFYSGTYTYTGTTDKAMIDGSGAAVYIAGGTFSSTSDFIFRVGDRDIMSPLHITGGDFTVTKSGAAIIGYDYHNADSKVDGYAQGYIVGRDVCGQVRATSWTYGNVILKIDGGNFHVNAANGHAVRTHFNVAGIQATALSNYPDGILDTDDTVYIEITGGVFTTSTNTIDAFLRDGRSGVNARYTTAEDGVNPTLNVTYNVSGGSFTGGCAWISLRDNGIFNISGGTFHSGATFNGDTRYIWIQNPSVAGGQVNISGGTFTETTGKRLINAAGAALTISGGTFTAKTNLLNLSDGDMVSDVTITGGTFRSTSTDSTILFNAGDSAQNWHEGTLRITGGTFTVDDPATASVRYSTAQTHTNYFTIEGGTFDGGISTTVATSGHTLVITGGRFKEGSGFLSCVPGSGYVGVNNIVNGYQEVIASSLRGFCGSQMRIGTDLGVYFYVLIDESRDSGTPSLIVSDAEGILATLTEYTKPAYYPNGSAVDDGSGHVLYCFFFEGLAPQRMGDELDLVFKLDDVSKFGNTFSVLEYCRRVRAAHPTGKVRAVTGALLNFGAAAQLYTDTNVGALVNADLADVAGAGTFSSVSEEHAVYGGTLGTAHFVKTEENGVAARGVRFDTGIQLYVRVVDTTGSETCTYSVGGGAAVACKRIDLGSNRFAFYTDAISLDDFDEDVTFTLSTGETCTYSVQAFVYYYQDHATDDNGKALARALWAYKTAVTGALDGWADFEDPDTLNP